MVARSEIPFNVRILELNAKRLESIKPVTSLDTFDQSGANFAENGLFSVSIFGRVGDDLRNRRYSYIDGKIAILHPVIYRTLNHLKGLYTEIIAGTAYAIFDEALHDFVRSDVTHGQTGFYFFLQHWKNIEFTETKSTERQFNIALIQKYKEAALTRHIVIMPAGLRDMELAPDGRYQEDDINTLYRRFLAIANTISDITVKQSEESMNNARNSLQNTFNQIYQSIEDRVSGRRKLIQNRWTARRIVNGTRNVITAMDTGVPYLGAPGAIGFNDTGIGLYQMAKAILPVTRYLLKNGFLSKVFLSPNQPATLVNKKTLQAERVELKPQYFDRWMTDEGLEKVITSFSHEDVRHRQLEIEGHWVGLVYKGKNGSFRLFQGMDEFPEGFDRACVFPLTFAELLYLSCYQQLNRYPLFVTRYPVTGMGSIYPSHAFVRTTIKVEARRELDENWLPREGDQFVAYQFPIVGSAFIDSLMPHSAKLGRLGADFDGDTSSGNAVYSDEAIAEVDHFLDSRRAYIDTSGRLLSTCNVATVELVMHNLTGSPK